MGARGRTLRTDIYFIRLKVAPVPSAGPDPLPATPFPPELTCRLGVRLGARAALRRVKLCCLLPWGMYPFTHPSFSNEFESWNWIGERTGDICLSVAPSHAQERGLEVDVRGPEKVSAPVHDCAPLPCFRARAAPASSVRLPGKHRLRRGRRTETGSAGFPAPPPGAPLPPRALPLSPRARVPPLAQRGPGSRTPGLVQLLGLVESRD